MGAREKILLLSISRIKFERATPDTDTQVLRGKHLRKDL